MNLKGVLEGLLFVSGEDGLTLEQIKELLNIDDNKLKEIILGLQNDYRSGQRGIKIEILASSLKLVTKKEHKEYYQKLLEDEKNDSLSQSSLETLAIIAYNDPITRIQVDEIRGVNSSYVIRKLLIKGLIEDKGRSDLPGKPILYGVTDRFLDYFGLQTIEDLPKMEENETDVTEADLFTSKYVET